MAQRGPLPPRYTGPQPFRHSAHQVAASQALVFHSLTVPVVVQPHTHRHARQRGQNVLEYGLLMMTIAVIVLLGVNAFGHQVEPWFASLAALVTTHT